MSYEKQTWVTGETITAEKLNHMEDGIAGSGKALYIVDGEYNQETGKCQRTGLIQKLKTQ